jgi:NADPH:quinone reductase-like Zn-dependent oxidoreductase
VPRAVRFDHYGGIDVLDVVDVPRPVPASGQLLVRVKAAGINPGEAKIRDGRLHDRFPASFPSGQGSDLAGIVEEVGPRTETPFRPGDEVIGFTNARASHAELVLVEAVNATARPLGVPWEVAGSLFVAGTTAVAVVRAVDPAPGEVVVLAGATGGVGSIAGQLARRTGARVIGLAGEARHGWLRAHEIAPVAYGDGMEEEIVRAGRGRIDALIDAVGGGYVQLALQLGVAPERIDTIVDFEAAQASGAKSDGSAAAASAGTLAHLAALVDAGELEVPVAAVYPLERVRDAFRELEEGHPLGKIVLVP